MKIKVKHDKDQQIFYAELNEGVSRLSYHEIDARTLDYRSTFVPIDLRGKGVAGDIVKYALDYARENDYKVVPTCSYVKNYIDKYPEYADLVVNQR